MAALSPDRAGQPLWLVTDPVAELRAGAAPPMEGPAVVVLGLGLGAETAGTMFFRDGGGPRAFAILTGALRSDAVAAALADLGAGPLVAAGPTAECLDLARIDALRRAARTSKEAPSTPRPVTR